VGFSLLAATWLPRVNRLLSDHEVRFVEANELPSFAEEIEREAH
jgi:hypothetical protein